MQTYKVAPGDTLGQIAVDQLGGYSKLGELLKANPGLSVDSSLTVGKSLSIPDIGQAHTRPSVANAIYTKPKSVSAKAGRTYTVKEGDNLWGIAASQLGKGARNSEIRAANPQMKSNALSVGMVLTLPDGSASKGTIAANVGKRSEHGTTTKQPRFKPGVVR
jgi:LysM repeat protein